ncbi:conserved hypothetical protein [Leptospira interrogans serovar Manilae]|uniref:Uncharacterized protein n=1 Tax=Leptospira interrogans serovar Manilae TaxID=214675 RepID=A0AAQ1P2X7_LEPIR|nr:hypothetical protein [Leptospira interrogans]AKP25931.1 hypothetical protein LIMLP_08240 [Leptospira interrogans serovar Manilae]AKP29716.1 hypothetical protein LIMHP_08235 [Leptospira interrogans serovar Manilae]EYU62477.1 hypothetical protein CI00_20040 [Leptospira interrogans serovar Manilae]SOR63405.1 conserved hypothetical protein [Leptospira interrogans serovar Manilae]
METLTLDELHELSYFVRSQIDEVRQRILDSKMVLGFDTTTCSQKDEFKKIVEYYEQELSKFEAIESKLEKMKCSVPI